MPQITFISHNGESKTISADNGLSVMETAIRNDVAGIEGDCGGACACATCHVYVDEQWTERLGKAEGAEADMLEFAHNVGPTSRLSCQIVVSSELDGLVVRTPERQN